jgi:GntR family transcriptional regulator
MSEPDEHPPFTFRIEPDDPAPAYVQLERQVRIAAADGALEPGARLPSVRAVAAQLRLATNTVARAYAELAREGVLVTRPGGGSTVAPRESLDRPALTRQRRERLAVLARQLAVRALAMGLEPDAVMDALAAEFSRRGRAVQRNSVTVTQVDDEPALLSSRNQLQGTVVSISGGEQIVEVRLKLVDGTEAVAVITRASLQRLGLQRGGKAIANLKATDITLSV